MIMDVREKLVELLTKYFGIDTAYYGIEASHLADHLIANGVTVQEWISVNDRLPRNYTPVLAYIPSLAQTMQQTVHECHIGADGEWHSSTAPAYREGVTHWMPMPQPPKGE